MKKTIIKILCNLFPNQIVNFAYNQLTNPQIKKLRENELEILNEAEKEILKFKNFDVQLYKWQGGTNSILLIHGWEGQAGNFSDIIKELIKENYTIFAFDAPSHGFSSKAKTSLFDFTELVGILIEKFKVKRLISHSFGGVATTYALFNNQHLAIEKYVLLTTPDTFSERIDDVSQKAGITEKVKNKLIKRLEKEMPFKVEDLNVSNFVKVIKVEKSLIIHDKNDKIIPIQRSKNVAQHWKNCEFMEIEGTGHMKILSTNFVIKKIMFFLK